MEGRILPTGVVSRALPWGGRGTLQCWGAFLASPEKPALGSFLSHGVG